MSVGELIVSIIGDMNGLHKVLSDVQKDVGDVGTRLNAAGAQISSAGSAMTAAITVPIVGAGLAFAGVAKEGMEFEKGMAQVYTLIPDMSKEAFGQMSADTLQFAKDMKVPTEEVLPALYDAIGSGIPQDNVFSFLEVAQKGAVAGATNVGVAVDTLTSLINAYGAENLSAADASDISFAGINVGKMSYEELRQSMAQVIPVASGLGIPLEQVVGALAAMTAQGTPTAQATTQLARMFDELAKEGTRANKMFTEVAGKSFPQFIKEGGTVQGALQLMQKGFLENSPAAQKLNQQIKDLSDPTSGLAQEFEAITGKSFKDFRKEGGEVTDALKILGIDTSEVEGRMSDMFGSIQGGNAVLTLTSRDGAILSDVMEEMERSAGQTDEAFAKISDTTSYAFESMSADIKNATTEMGVRLLPIIQDTIVPLITDTLIPAFEGAVNVIATVAEAFDKLPQPVKDGILAFLGVIAAIGPVLLAIGALVSAVGSIAAAFGAGGVLAGAISFISATILPALSAAFGIIVYTVIPIVIEAIALLATPFGLVAAALAVFVLAWKNNWFDIQGKAKTVWDWLKTQGDALYQQLERVYHAIIMSGSDLKLQFSAAWDAIKNTFSTISNTIVALATWLYEGLKGAYKAISDACSSLITDWKGNLESIKSTLNQAVEFIVNKLQSWYTSIQQKFNLVKDAANYLLNDWKIHWENFKTVLSAAVADIIAKLQSWYNEVQNKFNFVKNAALDLLNDWKGHWNNIQNSLSTAKSIIDNILLLLHNQIKGRYDAIIYNNIRLLNDWKGHWNNIQSATSAAANSLNSILTTLYNYIQNIFTQIRTAASNLLAAWRTHWSTLHAATTSAANNLNSVISSMYSAVQNKFNQILDAAYNLLNNWRTTWNNIISTAKNAGSQLVAAISGLPTSIKNLSSAFSNAGKAIMDALYNSIVEGFNKAIKKAKDLLSELRSYLPSSPAEQGPFKKLPDWSSAITTPLNKSVTEAASTAKTTGKNIISSISSGLKSAATGLYSSAKNTYKKLKSYLPRSPAEEGPFSEIPNWDTIFYDPLKESIAKAAELAKPLDIALSTLRSPIDSLSDGFGQISSVTNNSYSGDSITIGPNTLSNSVDLQALIQELNKYTANKRRARGLYK